LLKDASVIDEYLSIFQKLRPEFVMRKRKLGNEIKLDSYNSTP